MENIRTEVSYNSAGKEVNFGTPGSIRLDVVKFDETGEITGIWDLKTGKAGLTASRINQIRQYTGFGGPIIEIRPR